MPFDSKTGAAAGSKSTRKGSRNKATTEIRERFQELLENNLETLQKDLDSLQPGQRVKAIIELSKFVLPTLKATDLKAEIQSSSFTPLTILIHENPD